MNGFVFKGDPVYIKAGQVHGMAIQTCPRCGNPYMQNIPIDVVTASLVGSVGRMHCGDNGVFKHCNYTEGIDKAKCAICHEEKILFKLNLCEECFNRTMEAHKK